MLLSAGGVESTFLEPEGTMAGSVACWGPAMSRTGSGAEAARVRRS